MPNTKTLSDLMEWRYATKKMDPTKVVPTEDLDAIIEAVRMAPTSSGAQPFELYVITNPEVRAEIRAASYDQSPITDGSHLLVFAAWDNYTEERLDEVADRMAAERGDTEQLRGYYGMLKAMYLPRPVEVNHDHAARQAYIALGFAMLAAAERGVDSTPMEGFEADKVNAILDLPAKGLGVAVMLTLGYRDPEGDWLAGMPKVRRSREQMVTEIN